jgi:pyridoxal phosphate enzyme (YggS family)
MSGVAERLRENVGRVRQRIAAACERSGRDPADVRVVAVTKYAQWSWVEALTELGMTVLGESRPQQLLERSAAIQSTVEWHLIGHLQRNKVRGVLPVATLIHSVDSWRLLARIDQIAGELELHPHVLLQVNVSGEASKDGFSPDGLREVFPQTGSLANARVLGLMTMAPWSDDPATARPVFRGLRELRDELQAAAPSTVRLDHLSMGMSNDFEVGVEEGATLVRLGSVLFEGLNTQPRLNGE